ncbi:MAG: hypothetical protein GY839_02530 [candidate division Zixibacteria bacterium]|nr:hypothetical protein [candidate division Zixibacteria bacterium]
MKCYFHGSVNGEDKLLQQMGTVSFAIPDIGIIFRSRWVGNLLDCQYAALLSLMQFLEKNKKLLKDDKVEILSDASVVVYQLSKNAFVYKSVESYYRMVQTYKSKFDFKIHWIPEQDNTAYHGLIGTPPMKPTVDIKFDIKNADDISKRRGGVLPM